MLEAPPPPRDTPGVPPSTMLSAEILPAMSMGGSDAGPDQRDKLREAVTIVSDWLERHKFAGTA